MLMADGSLVSVKVMARALGIHPVTAYRMIKRGEVDIVHVGGRVLIPQDELQRLIHKGDPRPADIDRLVSYWFEQCDTDDPMVVLAWLASNAIQFRRHFPDIVSGAWRPGPRDSQ